MFQEDKISGVTQLYNADEDITQCISCQVVCFDTYKFAGNGTPSTVLCVASRDVQNHGKVSQHDLCTKLIYQGLLFLII